MAKNWKTFLKIAEHRIIEKGDFDGAIRVCDRIINSPENAIPKEIRVEAFIVRGNAYVKKGDFDRAISDYDEVIKLDPGNVTALQQSSGCIWHTLARKAISNRSHQRRLRARVAELNPRAIQAGCVSQIACATSTSARAIRAAMRKNRVRNFNKCASNPSRMTQKSRAQLQQVREQSEQDAQKLREQLRKVSEPAEIIAKYEKREHEYKDAH